MSAGDGVGPTVLQPFFRAVNFLCQPVLLYTAAALVFLVFLAARKYLVKPAVALAFAAAGALFFVLCLFNPHFYGEAVKPDNAPIWIMLIVFSVCLWAAFWQAVNNDERMRQGLRPDEAEAAEERLHVWPYLLYIEAIAAAFVLALLFIWSIGLDSPLEQAANPARTPNPSKAPWYFLGLQELLVYFDPWIAGVLLPGMAITGLIALPYCDPNPKGVGYYTFSQRKFAITVYLFGFVMMWLLLIFFGTFLRGQNWNFFGLCEPWSPHKLTLQNNVNLSELFWQSLLGRATPSYWLTREIPGFLLLAAYFTLLPALIAAVFKNFYKQLGFIRYSIVIMHLLVMLAVPVKMYLRWGFNVKYIVFVPEYFFNI
jgi:hypothetical protein